MADDENVEINYKEELERVTAERDAFATKLDEILNENHKLSAELKVQQAINRKSIGVTDAPPKSEVEAPKSITDAFTEFKLKENKKE